MLRLGKMKFLKWLVCIEIYLVSYDWFIFKFVIKYCIVNNYCLYVYMFIVYIVYIVYFVKYVLLF